MSLIAIETRQLTKVWDGTEALCRCSLCVERGTVYGLVGKNGAGKTTLFKLLLGLLRPTAGHAYVLGRDSLAQRTDVLRHTGCLIGVPVLEESLSAAENLRIHLAYMGVEGAPVTALLDAVGLGGAGAQPVRTFSVGMRQRLAIARALSHRPDVLILDEPLNGLDPVGQREMHRLFRRLTREEGVTVLLSSHQLAEIERLADRLGVLRQGHLVLQADTAALRQRYPRDLDTVLLAAMEGGEPDVSARA